MGYFYFFSNMLFWAVPFIVILGVVFNFVQIPFAFIHRFAVAGVMLLRNYILCLYFSLLCNIGVIEMRLSPWILLPITSWVLFYILGSEMHSADSKDQNLFFILLVLSVPMFFVLYFFRIIFLHQIITAYSSITVWLTGLPIIGTVLNFIVVTMAPLLCLMFALPLLLSLFMFIAPRMKKRV